MSQLEGKNVYEDTTKWKNICETTLKNYTNMLKRLVSEDRTSKYILIYYSLAVIIYSLTSEFYSEIYNTELSNFISIIMSVVLLIYSIINSNAKYPERISKIEHSINELKSLKRNFNKGTLAQQIEAYNTIVDSTELRADVDFFNTVKSMCRKKGIMWFSSIKSLNKKMSENKELTKTIDYLSEINRYYEQFRLFYKFMLKLLLYAVPVVIYVICFLAGENSIFK